METPCCGVSIRMDTNKVAGNEQKHQPSPYAFSLDPLSARSLGNRGERTRSRRVYLGDVTAYGRVQD